MSSAPSSSRASAWRRPSRAPAHRPAGTSDPATSAVYRPRRPTATPLYPVVQHHHETFLATAAHEDPFGDSVPAGVERDFRAYLKCAILAHGFARIRCGEERLKEELLPESFEPGDMIAVGYPGDPDLLGEKLREREAAPRRRNPLSDCVFSGS